VKIEFLLGAGGVGSCIYLTAAGQGVLIDAGCVHEGHGLRPPYWMPEKVNHIVLTHAHEDHVWWTPLVTKQYDGRRNRSKAQVYATAPTKSLAAYNLYDGVDVACKRQEYRGGDNPAYRNIDVEKCLERFVNVAFNQWREIGDGIRIMLVPAGHILGAASVAIQAEGKTVGFSGDLSMQPQKTVGGADWSCFKGLHFDAYVTETTYGMRPLPSKIQAGLNFQESLLSTLNSGNSVVIPAFAIGRSQEMIIRTVESLAENNFNYPIIVDGGARAVSEIYRSFGALPRNILSNRNVHFVPYEHSRSARYGMYEDLPKPFVIIAPAGMVNGGAIWYHIGRLCGNKGTLLMLVGYQAEGSTGRQIYENRNSFPMTFKHPGPKSDDYEDTLDCRVELVEFSGHADCNELPLFPEMIWPDKIFINHGDIENAEALKWRLEDKFPYVQIAKEGDCFEI
jgi:Cft2 family RNA processing exonuclease